MGIVGPLHFTNVLFAVERAGYRWVFGLGRAGIYINMKYKLEEDILSFQVSSAFYKVRNIFTVKIAHSNILKTITKAACSCT